MQLIAKTISYTYPRGKQVLHDINLSISNGEKSALVGDNGSGKSTLLRILAGSLTPDSGSVQRIDRTWFIPQHFGQFDTLAVAEVLQVQTRIDALGAIEHGSVHPLHFEILSEDWTIRDRIQSALDRWDLTHISCDSTFASLSGGEKTRVFLAGIDIHHPELVLMDEPTNHLDITGREKLNHLLRESSRSILVVSHDRELLDLCNPIYELSSLGLKAYGGNFTFYEEQKEAEIQALIQKIDHARQTISNTEKKYRETMQRKNKRNACARKKGEKEGLPRIVMHSMKNRAENSTHKLNDVHVQNIELEKNRLLDLKKRQFQLKRIKINLGQPDLYRGKLLFRAEKMNYAWPGAPLLWKDPLRFMIHSGDRVQVCGKNGSGKSTLIRILDEEIQPTTGLVSIESERRFLLDQEYSFIEQNLTILQQAKKANVIQKPDHELKTLLHRYLFDEPVWDQKCSTLSGGEMMRLSLCCHVLQVTQPDTILLDEPTNNLDLRNLQLLTQAISDYTGTLIVVSHDSRFIDETGINQTIDLLS